MNTTATIIFKRMEHNDEWEGYGYLGGRREALADGLVEHVSAMDAWVIHRSEQAGWSSADLFRWANSRYGRHFAEAMRYGAVARAEKSFVLPQD